MPLADQETISAQVVLKPAGGKTLDSMTAITSSNIADYTPSAEAVAQTTATFRAAGFEVGPVVGNSFSITAPADTFRKVFDAQLRYEDKTGVQAMQKDGSSSYELPLNELPRAVTRQIEAVTFTPPPEFGPTNFGP